MKKVFMKSVALMLAVFMGLSGLGTAFAAYSDDEYGGCEIFEPDECESGEFYTPEVEASEPETLEPEIFNPIGETQTVNLAGAQASLSVLCAGDDY
ncbi:MAG: hypothetical protein FWF77_07955, partial [Defluviitaleaceae bacterium]|nr:hypothetical protein [Defluviitaleaceae bacterium]